MVRTATEQGHAESKSPLEKTFEKNFRAISDGTYHHGLGTPGYLVTALVFQWGVVLTSNRHVPVCMLVKSHERTKCL